MNNNFGFEDFEAYTYLDYHNPVLSWNIARGGFCSPSEIPGDHNKSFLSVAMAGMLANSTPKRLYSELSIEKVRIEFFPDCVSRLNGFFVFDEIESIARFWECNSWGGHFSDEYLSDVGIASTKSTRVDSNWISNIVDTDGGLKIDWFNNAIKYWSGVPCPSSEPIWERIVEGFLTVWSSDVRINAMKEVFAIWPNSSKLLTYSSLCFLSGDYDGMLIPFFVKDEEGRVGIKYISRMENINNEDFFKKIVEKARTMPSINIPLDVIPNDSSTISMPDLTNFEVMRSPDGNDPFSEIVQAINRASGS